ncbi:hypothetical protein OAV07_00125 [Acidimicrobiales bacterium]|nr:hypothetical protein [Acidimicrobiaceae bacterium]MDB2391591.1 hypothetical protein [Acidimicrobiaceae bacterium]MDC3299906.1 hypothetical protein [Acidimicrobiales bacterium]
MDRTSFGGEYLGDTSSKAMVMPPGTGGKRVEVRGSEIRGSSGMVPIAPE